MPMILDEKGGILAGTPVEIAKRAVEDKSKLRAFFPLASVRSAKRDATVKDGEGEDETPVDLGPIEAVINTNSIDRYQSIVDPNGVDLTAYQENPVVLWQHGFDAMIGNWPIGVVTEITKSATEIVVKVQFDIDCELGAEIDRLYRKRILRGFSVGFIPKSYVIEKINGQEVLRYTEWELLELSAVSVPANPDALSRAMAETKVTELRDHLQELKVARGALPVAIREATGIAEDIDPKTVKPTEPETLVGDTTKAADKTNDDQPTREFSAEEIAEAVELLRESKAKGLEVGLFDPKETTEQETRSEEIECPWEIEWDEPFVLAKECNSASQATREAMAALVVTKGENTRNMMIHHHADSRLSWPAVAASMGRLLTKAINCTGEQCDAIYDHLAEHYREIGVEVPEAGAKSGDQATDLALEGRIALIDESDYAWIFSRHIVHEGESYGEFVRIDDRTITKMVKPSAYTRVPDPTTWGRRTAVKLSRDEQLLAKVDRDQRQIIETLKEVRAGAKFSKATKSAITSLADSLESLSKTMKQYIRDLSGVAGELRDLIASDEAQTTESTTKSDGGGDTRDGGSDGDANGSESLTRSKTGVVKFERKLG